MNMWFFNKKNDKKDRSVLGSWEEFRDTGLFWFVNMILHLFGWTLSAKIEDGHILGVYPKRTSLRGFAPEINSNGYIKVTKYLKDNIKDLYREVKS
jgi:hypothetical protein